MARQKCTFKWQDKSAKVYRLNGKTKVFKWSFKNGKTKLYV